MELVGVWVPKTAPIWIPGGLIAFYIYKPEQFQKLFGPFYPAIKIGILTLIIMLITTIILLTLRFFLNRKREKKNYEYYRLVPHQDQSINSAAIHEMIEQIAGYKRPRKVRIFRGREWFQWLIHKNEEGIIFYMGFPQDRKTGILRTIKNAYPEAEIHPAKHVKFPSQAAYSGRMAMDYKGINEVKPLASFSGKNGIGNLVSYMEQGTWIDITFSPSSPYKLMKKIKKSQLKMKKFHKKMSDMDSFAKADLKAVSKRLTGRDKVFQVSVSVASESKQGGGVVHSIATTLGSIMNDENGLSLRRFRKAIERSPYPFRFKMDWIGRELANLLQLPSPEHDIFQEVPHLQKGERALEPHEMTNGIGVGYMKHPVINKRMVKIPYNVFKEHWFMSGKTGSGKSSEILMILQSMIDDWVKDHHRNPGFTLFDPAKETALTVISRLKKAENEGANIPWEKIHYISLTKDDYPLAMNLLHKSEGELSDTVKNNIMNILDTAFNNDGAPKMRRWIENAILALLADNRPHSILGVNRMFQDEKFRAKVVKNIKDPILRTEWLNYNLKDTDMTLDAIRTRMQPFQSSIYMRRMFGQTKFGLNLRKWMDEGHLVLIDMKDVNDANIALTVGHMVTQYHQVAIKRQSGSKLHMLLVDEAHLASIPIMDTIIAFDRKFGLGLGIITQYMDQLPDWLKKAIKGNMGTILSGTQGDESAAQVESMTNGRFTRKYVQELPSNTVAVFTKEKVGNTNKITTCTVETEPPFLYKDGGEVANYQDQNEMTATFKWLESIALDLQKRDGDHFNSVDEKIKTYLGIEEIQDHEEEGLFSSIDLEKEPLRGEALEENSTDESLKEFIDDFFSQESPPRQGESYTMKNEEKVSKRNQIDEPESQNKSSEEGVDAESFFF